MDNKTHYDRVQVSLHWVIALMIFGMIGLGAYMTDLPKQSELPPGEESVRAFYFLLHKSIGITVLGLILMRVLWRFTHQPPALPNEIPKIQQKASKVVHGLLYVVMLGTPISGYMQSAFSKYHTKFWGIELPRVAEPNLELKKLFSEVHEIFVFILVALIVLHVGAAIKHRLEGNNLFERMSFKR